MDISLIWNQRVKDYVKNKVIYLRIQTILKHGKWHGYISQDGGSDIDNF